MTAIDRLCALVKADPRSVASLLQDAGVPATTYYAVIRGERGPSFGMVAKIVHALGGDWSILNDPKNSAESG